jgi:hypothetical protein
VIAVCPPAKIAAASSATINDEIEVQNLDMQLLTSE